MSAAGLVALFVALAVAVALGVVRRFRSGRLRAAAAEDSARLTAGDISAQSLGERATLVHFSSAFCRPCVAVRHVLHDVAERVPGVTAVEVDAESHLELVRRLNISSTPTTLLLDRSGAERRRATGVPKRHEVIEALTSVLD
ncbi:MAG TPA: thioredoxin family protein [Mycobacteriales bacterium]|jgi:thioredoxin-like negative regulator of GroEL|nr:thioredoxin family protein [Mycobacteriales bacterium]